MAVSKTIIYIDMDDTLCDYKAAFSKRRNDYPETEYPQSMPGFFLNLNPLPGALDVFGWLNEQAQFEIFILTSPSIKNPLCYTEKRLWVEEHLGFDAVSRLIISPHKNLCRGNFLIDDRVEGQGQDRFDGAVIQFGSNKFPSWLSIKTYFNQVLSMSC